MRTQSSVKCLLSGWVSDRSIYQRLRNILIKLYSLQIDMKNDIFFKSVDRTETEREVLRRLPSERERAKEGQKERQQTSKIKHKK